MSGLEPSRSRLPRRQREDRAYKLVLATGGFGVLAAVGILLAIAGVLGWGLPLLAAAIAIVCGLMFRRTVSR
jgi:putative flippase GtrA